MHTFKVYISQFSTVTVTADTEGEAERIAIEAYNTNSPAVERYKPEVEVYVIFPPEAA